MDSSHFYGILLDTFISDFKTLELSKNRHHFPAHTHGLSATSETTCRPTAYPPIKCVQRKKFEQKIILLLLVAYWL